MSSTKSSEISLRLAPSSISWTEAHKNALAKDHPFTEIDHETPEMYIERTYLQALWLPESISPLSFLIPALLRVNVVSSSNAPHPVHALLEPILLSGRASSEKYRIELPHIIAEGGGEGEIEETMMWYTLSYEKNNVETQARPGTQEYTEELLADDKWRIKWFERMERRELAVQLLLHMFILTLPGLVESVSPKKRKRKDRAKQKTLIKEVIETRVQIYMDKLSTWQLVKSLEHLPSPSLGDDHDWVQKFFLQVVEPRFKTSLPDHCAALRLRWFSQSHSMFSDDDTSSSTSRSSSPFPQILVEEHPKKRAKTTDVPRQRSPSISTSTNAISRARSRSLSVALVQERAESMGAISKKRFLNREVSMSRVFKPRPKPLKRESSSLKVPPVKKEAKDECILLVEETPVKPKPRPTLFQRQNTFPSSIFKSVEDEEIWDLPSSSPDILLLRASPEGDLTPPTPTKKRAK